MKSLKLSKYLDISTGHITESDGALVLKHSAPFFIGVIDGGLGSLFYVPPKDYAPDIDLAHRLGAFGFSTAFTNIFLKARKAGARMIRFDGEGDSHDLPTFDW